MSSQDLGWSRKEGAEEADGRQLNCELEAVVIAAMDGDQLTVAIVEVEEPLELPHRWRLP